MKPLTKKTAVILMSFLIANCSQKKSETQVSLQNSTTGVIGSAEVASQAQPPQSATESTSVAAAGSAPVQVAPQGQGITQTAPSSPKQELESKLADSVASQEASEPAACLTYSFQHHAAPNHALGPDCAHHKNRIALPQEILKGEHDLNHLCVRVDGVAVTHVREKETLILGAAPRARSVISVRACRKGSHCQESCKIPKDELISDLTGDSAPSEDGWDQESALKVNGAIDDTIKRELASLDEEEVSKEWALDGAPTEHLAGTCGSSGKKTLTARKN